MNELQIFEHPSFGNVRTLTEDGKTLFCAKDVAAALGYKNTRDAIIRHCKGVVKRDGVSLTKNQHGATTEQTVEMAFIPEGDIYRLAARSELPGAAEFESWIFDEVLPSIRKHGGYIAGQENMTELELLAKAVLVANSVIEDLKGKLKEAEKDIHMLSIVNRHQEPMVDYFMACVDKSTLTSLRETAKLLHVKEKKMISFLLENKFLYRSPKGKLLPHGGRPMDFFDVKEAYDKKTGWFGVQTFVTPRGREALRLLLAGKPESCLWGAPYVQSEVTTPAEKIPDMTEGDAYRLEEYCTKKAREERAKAH